MNFEDELKAQDRHIAALAAQTAAVERNAAALNSMPEFLPLKAYEWFRQPGLSPDFQPVSPGEGWELTNWHESADLTVYLWRRAV